MAGADQFGRKYVPPIIQPDPSGYSPYAGMGLFGGGYGLGGPITVSPITGMPGYDLSKLGLSQSLAQAKTSARQARGDAGRQYAKNQRSINSSASDRGIGFSGFRQTAQGEETKAYQSVLDQIASGLSNARQGYNLSLDQLALQNASYLATHPTGPLAIQAAMLTPGGQQYGGSDPAYNPYWNRQRGPY